MTPQVSKNKFEEWLEKNNKDLVIQKNQDDTVNM